MKDREQELLRVAHGGEDPWAFCLRVGIDSVRNLGLYLRKSGVYDGRAWSHRDIAEHYRISRPRSVQICARTEAMLKAYYEHL